MIFLGILGALSLLTRLDVEREKGVVYETTSLKSEHGRVEELLLWVRVQIRIACAPSHRSGRPYLVKYRRQICEFLFFSPSLP
jgi:hypothetical protein